MPKIAAAGIVLHHDDYVCLGFSIKKQGWEIPGGKHEEDETSEACALRETDEECGISPDGDLVLEGKIEEKKCLFLVYSAECYVMRKPKLKEPHKHSAWTWHNLFNLPRGLLPECKIALTLWKPTMSFVS